MFAALQNEDTLSVYMLACVHVCVHASALALPSYRWDSTFSHPLLLHLIFRSVAELRLQSAGTLALKNLEKSVSLLQTRAVSDASPAVKSSNCPLSTASASSFVLANSAMQLRVINAKVFGTRKLKSVGTAQNKLNCKIKEHRQFS